MAKQLDENNPASVIGEFLKKKKDQHLNFEKEAEQFYVSSGSLKLDCALGMGLPTNSLHRFCGSSSSGKTSAALGFAKNFVDTCPNGEQRFTIYIKAEGRLSPNIKERSGLNFVDDYNELKPGDCFVLKTNIYEMAVEFMLELISKSAGSKERYFFIVDSTDALIPYDSLAKTAYDAQKVAGGAVIAGNFLKRASLPISTYGHVLVLISQVRDVVKINQYEKGPVRLSVSTGGNALYHFPDWILEFEKYNNNPKNADCILKYPSKDYNANQNPVVGHYAKIVIKKSNTENQGYSIRYPIKHGQKGNSVWVERELAELMLDFECITKKGAWLYFVDTFFDQLKCDLPQIDFPDKFQGNDRLFEFIEAHPKLRDYLVNSFRKQILDSGFATADIQVASEDETTVTDEF